MMDDIELRRQIVDAMVKMDARGLNRGTAGNVSARAEGGMLITPSGVVPERLSAEQIVFVADDGTWDESGLKPSSEWRMHLGILQRRADANAVIHCHSRHATILACAGIPIPALHYMIAVSGGAEVAVAPYETFGTEELAKSIADTLGAHRRACLLANHGQIAIGRSLGEAFIIADEIEEQAAVYCGTLAIGGPKLLDNGEMMKIGLAFMAYGQRKD